MMMMCGNIRDSMVFPHPQGNIYLSICIRKSAAITSATRGNTVLMAMNHCASGHKQKREGGKTLLMEKQSANSQYFYEPLQNGHR